MHINLNELNIKKCIDINYDVSYDSSLPKAIKDLVNAKVVGKVMAHDNNDFTLSCTFSGQMILIDDISLKEVPYDFSIEIEENAHDLEENYQNCWVNMQNVLDLKEILWQNIVLEVPISYSKEENVHMHGEGWELKSEEEKSAGVDPRLKKLEDLLKGDD